MKSLKEKVKLTYYYDALCGWCYGFSDEFSKFINNNQDNIEVELISGGLFLGARAGKVNHVAPHIKSGAYQMVEERTGVKFGTDFLADVLGEGNLTLNSLYGAIALCIVKDRTPEHTVAFAKILLDAVYEDGMDTIDLPKYGVYAAKIGFDIDEFNALMQEDKYFKLAEQDFSKFSKSKASGMPSLVVHAADADYLIAGGYASSEDLQERITQFL